MKKDLDRRRTGSSGLDWIKGEGPDRVDWTGLSEGPDRVDWTGLSEEGPDQPDRVDYTGLSEERPDQV